MVLGWVQRLELQLFYYPRHYYWWTVVVGQCSLVRSSFHWLLVLEES